MYESLILIYRNQLIENILKQNVLTLTRMKLYNISDDVIKDKTFVFYKTDRIINSCQIKMLFVS